MEGFRQITFGYVEGARSCSELTKARTFIAEQDQLPCGFSWTPDGNCRETETSLVPVCHAPRQPLQNRPSGHLWGWATSRSTEENLDGQHQRVHIPARAGTVDNGLLQKRLEKDFCWIIRHTSLRPPLCSPPPHPGRPSQSKVWTELNEKQLRSNPPLFLHNFKLL